MIGLWMRSAIFGLALLLLVGTAGAWAGPPTETVKQAIENTLDILKNPTYQDEVRRQKAKAVIDPHFDYQEMAKRSLGPTWGSLSGGQRQEFVALFAQLL